MTPALAARGPPARAAAGPGGRAGLRGPAPRAGGAAGTGARRVRRGGGRPRGSRGGDGQGARPGVRRLRRGVRLDLAARILTRASDETRRLWLAELPEEHAEFLRRKLRYPPGTAGALVDPLVLALPWHSQPQRERSLRAAVPRSVSAVQPAASPALGAAFQAGPIPLRPRHSRVPRCLCRPSPEPSPWFLHPCLPLHSCLFLRRPKPARPRPAPWPARISTLFAFSRSSLGAFQMMARE